MTTQPHTDAHASTTSIQTERALHGFVRDAVARLSEVLKNSAPEFEDDIRWERGADGHFRERKKSMRKLCWILSDEWLRLLPEYQTCIESLKSDAVIGPHIDRLVGTSTGGVRLEADDIVKSLMYIMLDDEGRLAFTDERFHSKWQELVGFFGADQIVSKTVAPLSYLVVPAFPLRLNNELVLDRLTDDEVTRCYQGGVIRPDSPRVQLINGEVAVGIRRTKSLPKLIWRGDELHEPPEAEGEGSFGSRPLFREDLMVGDVLLTLRLFKHTQIRALGHANWTDAPWLNTVTSYGVFGPRLYGEKLELSEVEVHQFLKLWHLLEEGAARFDFSIHRFNLAFDRGFSEDRIVDLVIAAESLFLGDDHGELSYRLALRAAKFIDYPKYSEFDIYDVMHRAYGLRSAIVHGGNKKSKKTHLPGNQSANLPTFIDAIEEIVRLGLRKALSMKEEDGKKMRKPEYWNDLILSRVAKPDPSAQLMSLSEGENESD